jgi:hypothetical protein
MSELFDALKEVVDKIEADRQAAAEEARQQELNRMYHQIKRNLSERARVEENKQRRLENACRIEEEKKRRDKQQKHETWVKGQETAATMIISMYPGKIKDAFDGVESVFRPLLLEVLGNPDSEAGMVEFLKEKGFKGNTLREMEEAKKAEVLEYLKRELKEKLNGNPFACLLQ